MEEIPDGANGDDNIENNDCDEIIACWAEGMSLSQIARKMRLPIKTVSRELKRKQREFVDQGEAGYG